MEHFGTVSIVKNFNHQFNCKLPAESGRYPRSLPIGRQARVRLSVYTAPALATRPVSTPILNAKRRCTALVNVIKLRTDPSGVKGR